MSALLSPTPETRPLQGMRLPFVPVDDPVLPLPSVAEMEAAMQEHPHEFLTWLRERQDGLEARRRDPLRHGFEPKIWNVVDDLLVAGKKIVLIDPPTGAPKTILGGSEVYLSGGNRSSKTEFAASRIVRVLVGKINARTWCFHTTGPSSIAMQQPRIWKYLPPEWKTVRKHTIADIKYGQKNGFAGITPTFVGPNGSQNWFKNYAQGIGTIEGEELDAAWFDELVPYDFIDTTRYRLTDRRGIMIITFTPVEGYTPTVAELTEGAVDALRVPAVYLPKIGPGKVPTGEYETVPRVQMGNLHKQPNLRIVYFHITDNPFSNPEEIVIKARARGRTGILERCYGVAEKLGGTMFPTFNRAVHTITRAQFEEACREGTNYQLGDPCSGRNFFMFWARALPGGQTVIYREWPSPGQFIQGIGDPGPWAEFDASKPDGKRGPAQRPWGFGLVRIIEEILRAEGWRDEEISEAIARRDCSKPRAVAGGKNGKGKMENGRAAEVIFERLLDSRFGNAPTITRNSTETLIDALADLGMVFEPTNGEHLREGIDRIHDLLYCNREKPLGPENRPRLLVVEDCVNVIWAFTNWTGLDGQHGACKDPMDLVRYLALREPEHFTADDLKPRGGGAY